MCGIAGVLAGPGGRPADDQEMKRMVALLRHRGPDGWGTYRAGPLALAHTRLAIVGLADGHQPLTNEDGQLWVTGNGEIFNYPELRQELEACGHHFRTSSDTEVLLHAYEQWGEAAWRRLNGQFAFGLWDGREGLLWLVRDPFGILPLQWARVGDALVFASEAKAIFAGGRLKPSLSPAGLAQVFTCWSATAPTTVFDGLASVRPGCALRVTRRLAVEERPYWSPRIVVEADDIDIDDAADMLDEAIGSSVSFRLRADVPVGCYISGGLDSSIIAAFVRRHRNGADIDSFGIRFADPAFDETAEQRLIAEHLGTRHKELLCDAGHIAHQLEQVVWHCETPLLRTAPVPLFMLSDLVRQSRRKVVLSGEGADELLAGYNIFKEDRVRRFWARQPHSQWRPALLDRLYPYVGDQSRPLWQRFFSHRLHEVGHPFYSHLVRWHNGAWSTQFLAPEIQAALDVEELTDDLRRRLPAGWEEWEPLARAQAVEQATFMSSYLLSSQGDRVAMAHGVEVRYPFLDPAVVALCNRLPSRCKLLGLRDKRALRRLGHRLIPATVAGRPKRPYRAPVGPSLFGPAAPPCFAELLSDSELAKQSLIASRPASYLIEKARRNAGRMSSEREEMALVGLLTLRMLEQQFGSSFAARVSAACFALNRTPPNVDATSDHWKTEESYQ